MTDHPTIIFCGTPDFAVPSLTALLGADFHIPLVVTQPDKPQGRKQVITPPEVKVAALARGLPVFQPQSFNKEFLPYLQEHNIAAPDFLVVVAYGALISEEILHFPKRFPVNVHGSLLPRWRGAAPVENAILAGDTETGITVQVMAKELDAGPVLSMERIKIGPRDTRTTLREKLSTIGADLLVHTLQSLPEPKPQPAEGITFCKKLKKEDGLVDPAVMTAADIDRRIRALTPWPGVTCTIDNVQMKLLDASLDTAVESTPLPCAENSTLHLISVQPAGKKAMSGAAWARGRRT